jgi:hypothetical protein
MQGSVHKQCEYFHHMVKPTIRRASAISQGAYERLSYDGADLSRCSADTVTGGSVSCWEHLTGHLFCQRARNTRATIKVVVFYFR